MLEEDCTERCMFNNRTGTWARRGMSDPTGSCRKQETRQGAVGRDVAITHEQMDFNYPPQLAQSTSLYTGKKTILSVAGARNNENKI